MSTLTANWLEAIEKFPVDSVVTLHRVAWDEYEELLDQVGEAGGLRISYDDGTLQVMTLSPEHESYAEFISGLVRLLSVRLRINIRFFGSTTIKRRARTKGTEPDACFYVQSVAAIGNRMQLDFALTRRPMWSSRLICITSRSRSSPSTSRSVCLKSGATTDGNSPSISFRMKPTSPLTTAARCHCSPLDFSQNF